MHAVRGALACGLCVLSLSLAASPVFAQTVTIGNPVFPLSSDVTMYGEHAQTFTVPPGVTHIVSAKIAAHRAVTSDLSIRDGIGVGSVSLSPIITILPAGSSDAILLRELFIPSEGIAVVPGQVLYLASSNGSIAVTKSSYYSGGKVLPDYGYDIDSYFIVEFKGPHPIPTLSEWGLIILGLGLAGASLAVILRRQRLV